MPRDSQNQPDQSDQRARRAEHALESYEFGDVVAEMSGWEYDVPGREWVRTIYLESDSEYYSIDAATERARFHVRFADNTSDDVVEVFARNAQGADFGFLGTSLDELNAQISGNLARYISSPTL